MPEQLTTSQTARKLELSRERVRQLVQEGRLKAAVTPLGRLYDSASVERLAKERRLQRKEASQ